jgi:hypothetical protein
VISMMNEKAKLAIAGFLDMFSEGNVPGKIAIAANPSFDVPSSARLAEVEYVLSVRNAGQSKLGTGQCSAFIRSLFS